MGLILGKKLVVWNSVFLDFGVINDVPQVFNVFPMMFPITSHFISYVLPKAKCSYPINNWAKGKYLYTFVLRECLMGNSKWLLGHGRAGETTLGLPTQTN
jgi:hypothetical protein